VFELCVEKLEHFWSVCGEELECWSVRVLVEKNDCWSIFGVRWKGQGDNTKRTYIPGNASMRDQLCNVQPFHQHIECFHYMLPIPSLSQVWVSVRYVESSQVRCLLDSNWVGQWPLSSGPRSGKTTLLTASLGWFSASAFRSAFASLNEWPLCLNQASPKVATCDDLPLPGRLAIKIPRRIRKVSRGLALRNLMQNPVSWCSWEVLPPLRPLNGRMVRVWGHAALLW